MPNVRTAQFGQTAINKPLFEVLVNGKRYAFSTDDNGRVMFRTPDYLRSLGVYSDVAKRFESSPADIRQTLRLDANNTTTRDYRFPALALGAGLAFVEAWSNSVGWKSFNPIVYQNFNA
ncbi:hypothetical protein GCM10028806_19550 [Spirosoma terrae]|uniref:Uncharacterized protein n=1 Tax=Spirosoma terrae TaxID=1968276 RepID=A0A6L9L8N1_9BACT|nr:hypothetical protein [Spirosoma terrae]NDU94728.1 hypothetical protein [Spirosoma terrae]